MRFGRGTCEADTAAMCGGASEPSLRIRGHVALSKLASRPDNSVIFWSVACPNPEPVARDEEG